MSADTLTSTCRYVDIYTPFVQRPREREREGGREEVRERETEREGGRYPEMKRKEERGGEEGNQRIVTACATASSNGGVCGRMRALGRGDACSLLGMCMSHHGIAPNRAHKLHRPCTTSPKELRRSGAAVRACGRAGVRACGRTRRTTPASRKLGS